MLRTVAIESTARGGSNSLVIEPAELNCLNRVLALSEIWWSPIITLEGWVDFHVWATRSVAVSLAIRIVALWPCQQDGVPPSTNPFQIAVWAAAGPNYGSFYFGRQISFSTNGQVFRFGPLIKIGIANSATSAVTVNLALLCND